MSLFKRYYPVLLTVVMAVLHFGMNTYWTEVAVNVGLYALLALSLNVILGQAGIFHMGHAAFYAVGAYTYGLLNTYFGLGFWAVLPVGGIKEKILAGVARGLKHVIIPSQNVKDLEEVPKELLKKIKVHPAHTYDDVLALAFEPVKKTAARAKKAAPATEKK